ncbi:MAG: hypothetical protein MUF48_10370 [Pirellulaceae bacterium]|jgi:hypothetical protein|nr:hypothetical protein [Pirellulaceae bacterium]
MSGAGAGEEKRQRWRMIASLLGAPIREEPEPAPEVADQPVASTPETVTGAPAGRAVRPKPSRAGRPPGDWHSLCAQLGIEAPPAPAAPAEPVSPAGDASAAESGWRVGVEPAAAPTPDAGETWEAVEPDEPHDAVEDAADDATPTYFDPDATGDDDSVDDWDSQRRASQCELEAAEDRREPEDAASDGDEPVERRRRRRRKRRSGARNRDEAEVVADERSAADENLTDDDVLEAEQLRDDDDESELSRGEEARSRRAARRERREGEGTRDADTVPELDFEEGDADEEEDFRYRAHATDDDDDGDDTPGGEGRAKHKKIPTWEETIGVIVANNLELRRREGSSKGRPPRGRRRGGRNGNDRR